jgi:GNAT superfamily N-acetyltransferase
MPFSIRDVPKAVASIRTLSEEFYEWGDVQIRIRKSPFLLEFTGFLNNERACGFTLVEQVNCCGVLVSTKTWVETKHQKQGIAQALMPFKEAIAREFGYSSLAATVNMTGNPAEAHILEKFGWWKGFEFFNKRTKNTVAFWHKTIRDE